MHACRERDPPNTARRILSIFKNATFLTLIPTSVLRHLHHTNGCGLFLLPGNLCVDQNVSNKSKHKRAATATACGECDDNFAFPYGGSIKIIKCARWKVFTRRRVRRWVIPLRRGDRDLRAERRTDYSALWPFAEVLAPAKHCPRTSEFLSLLL